MLQASIEFLMYTLPKFIAGLFSSKRKSEDEDLTVAERSTKEQYGYVPRAGHYLLLIALLVLVSMTGKSQVFTTVGGGFTNASTKLSITADLQVGYRYKNTFASVGYLAIKDSGEPAFLNTRAGAIVLNQEKHCIVVYGGYVRALQSLDDKSRNYNTWQVGGQYHFCFYKNTNFYTGLTYTHAGYVTATIGMSIGLFKD